MMTREERDALQLIARLQEHSDVCGRAIVEGKGGTKFPDREPHD